MANILLWQQLKSNKTRRRLRKVEGGDDGLAIDNNLFRPTF